MFNYTKEVIVNDINNVVIDTTNDILTLKRGGEYKLDNIVDNKIYKTIGVSGQTAQASLTVGADLTAGAVYRITMFVKTPNAELSDFAYPNYTEFGKPIVVEFSGVGSHTTAAGDKDAAKIAEILKLALQPSNELYKVSVASNVVTVELAESWMEFDSIKFYAFNALTDEFDESAAVTVNKAVRANRLEFATAKWLVENLRFPSYPNLRYNRLYSDEAPVAGTVYNQYSFQYKVQKSVPGGLSAVGQVVDSVVTVVFYLPNTVCDDTHTAHGAYTSGTFEALIDSAKNVAITGTSPNMVATLS